MPTEEQKHQVKYFIKRFEAIPEEMWACFEVGEEGKKQCALGHAGIEHRVLMGVFKNRPYLVALINDGRYQEYPQPTPKQRMLAALYDLLKK